MLPVDRANAQNASDYPGSECAHGTHDHLVQFYEADHHLIESAGGFIASGLAAGETVLVVVTDSHKKELITNLEGHGLEIDSPTLPGRFVCLDVERVQADLTVNGDFSGELFTSFATALLEQAVATRRPFRVFGELVALYWAEGKYATAIEIEKRWDDLVKKYRFPLYCAYPCRFLEGKELFEPLKEVCQVHSRIIPAESYSSLTATYDQSREITLLQQKALTLSREIAAHEKTVQQLGVAKAALEAELAKSQEWLRLEQIAHSKADSLNQLKDEFLATVSHELRTPLNAIIGWSQMLHAGRLDARTSTLAVESIERNALSQAHLIECLIDLSKMIAGKVRLQLAAVEVGRLLDQVVDNMKLEAQAKAIEVNLILDPEAGQIVGEADRLQQIFSNLLSNAIKFTPEKGHIYLELKRLKDEVAIEVTDDGEGIEPEFVGCVFDKFRQADAGITRKHTGLGLGLSIVRYLVEMHGGYITVGSPGINLGTSFVVHLPVAGPRTKLVSLTDHEPSRPV